MLNIYQQSSLASKKADDCIAKNEAIRSKVMILFLAVVRSHMDCCVSLWDLHGTKDWEGGCRCEKRVRKFGLFVFERIRLSACI